MTKIYKVQMNSKGMPNFSTAVEVADRPQDDDFKNFDRESLILLIECQKERIGELLADRPQAWVDKAISIIDDMQREGIIDYEQAWEFRMRAMMKGADDE